MSLTTLRRILMTVAFLGAGVLAANAPAAAQDSGARRLALLPPVVGASSALQTHALSGLALDGFDPVSYFLGDEPRAGRPEHETIWAGAAWRFASAANKAAFLTHPNAYAPRLGGYDALAMAQGKAVEASPRVAQVVDRRLYLFRSPAERERFLAEADAAIRAETFWLDASAELARE